MPGPDYKPEQPLTDGQRTIMDKLRNGPNFQRLPEIQIKTEFHACFRCRGSGTEPGFGRDIAAGAHEPCKECKGLGELKYVKATVESPVKYSVLEATCKSDSSES